MIKGRLKLFSDDLLTEWLSTLPFTPHRTNCAPPCRWRRCLFPAFPRPARCSCVCTRGRVGRVLRVNADEEMFAQNNQRAFGFEHFVQGLRRNGQVFKPEPQENRAFGLVDFQRICAQLALEQRDGSLCLIAVKRPDDVV